MKGIDGCPHMGTQGFWCQKPIWRTSFYEYQIPPQWRFKRLSSCCLLVTFLLGYNIFNHHCMKSQNQKQASSPCSYLFLTHLISNRQSNSSKSETTANQKPIQLGQSSHCKTSTTSSWHSSVSRMSSDDMEMWIWWLYSRCCKMWWLQWLQRWNWWARLSFTG